MDSILGIITGGSDTAPEMHIVDVTPEQAQIWLGLNTANRQVKPHQVDAYAADMREDRWALNGDSIRFTGTLDDPRKLIDGQHRLLAVLKSGRTVRMIVACRIDEDAQVTIDAGSKRSVADNLRIRGGVNTVVLASAANLALLVSTGRLAGGSRLTNATVQAFIDEHAETLTRSASIAVRYARRADVTNAMVAYTHWELSKLSPADADAFWRDAAEKADLRSGDPVLALVNLFSESRRQRRNLDRRAQLSVIYRAWNARRAGRSLSVLKINSPKGGLVEIPVPR